MRRSSAARQRTGSSEPSRALRAHPAARACSLGLHPRPARAAVPLQGSRGGSHVERIARTPGVRRLAGDASLAASIGARGASKEGHDDVGLVHVVVCNPRSSSFAQIARAADVRATSRGRDGGGRTCEGIGLAACPRGRNLCCGRGTARIGVCTACRQAQRGQHGGERWPAGQARLERMASCRALLWQRLRGAGTAPGRLRPAVC